MWLGKQYLSVRSGCLKSLMLFLQELLHECGSWCCTSTIRDWQTVTERFEHEGLSFLTITLPAFGKDFEKSLDEGMVGPNAFAGFSRKQGLPRFLGGFLDLVFDRRTGLLVDSPSIDAIRAVRQFTLMCGKINLPCTPAREKAAIRRFIDCEQDTRKADATVNQELVDRFNRIGTVLWGDIFTRLETRVREGDIYPKHGPGSVADKLRGNAKWSQREWTERLDRVFPHWEHLVTGRREEDFHLLSHVSILEPGAERPVRVVTVPKTLKTPRIIAIEPSCMQYMQQGLLAAITEEFRRSDSRWALVGWDDQVPNQHLARKGSRNGALATLDLSEASDRVSNQHVRGLLRHYPFFSEGVDAARSRKADVPDHGVIRLAKFASMGSALCFPFEAIVFTTIIFAAIEKQRGSSPLTNKDIKSFVGSVRVYGDDIIVPVEYVHSVIEYLEAFGLKVNSSKSFWTGKFRESCGEDFFDGHDVSYIKVREKFPTSRKHASEIVSTVSLRNQLYKAGYWRSAAFLDALLERILPLPRVAETSPMLGRHSFLGYETQRMCTTLHRPLVKGMKVRAVIPVSLLDGQDALLKCLTRAHYANSEADNIWNMPSSDVEHLKRAGRPYTVNTKVGWGPSA